MHDDMKTCMSAAAECSADCLPNILSELEDVRIVCEGLRCSAMVQELGCNECECFCTLPFHNIATSYKQSLLTNCRNNFKMPTTVTTDGNLRNAT